MRKLKYHEAKLLRKVDLYSWKNDENIRVAKIMRRYLIQNREDYTSYNRLAGMVKQLCSKLKTLKSDDKFRIEMTDQLLNKCCNMGLINSTKSLKVAEEVTASAFCRRRMSVVLVRMKMAETLKLAVTFIEQGHIRVGPQVVTDPAFLISRSMEDFVTWVDSSKIRRTVQKYNDKLDDFDLL